MLNLLTSAAPAFVQMMEIAAIFIVLAGWPAAILLLGYIWITRPPAPRDLPLSEERGAALAAKAVIERGAGVLDSPTSLSFERKRREADALAFRGDRKAAFAQA